jgi:hypothetical protein
MESAQPIPRSPTMRRILVLVALAVVAVLSAGC